jgi:pyruvate kinase
MPLPTQHTKIVCTIGPASANRETLAQMMNAGMNICRLNFAHGDFDSHAANIRLIRETAAAVGHRISVYADLPGPKIRLGAVVGGQCVLEEGATVTLTTDDVDGTAKRLPVQFPELTKSVVPGDRIFLNDGFLQLTVAAVNGSNVDCRVDVGGSLASHKGVNIPGKELPIKAFTPTRS